ncbi:hypothetical protein AB0J80_27870 [Actinoplanes sp. NPDC049548]|uniref:hypothetical protein n=1 Tax=Actinoplanes sp. NPDC049548 TaxID=3155152 RepID=UPI00341657C6
MRRRWLLLGAAVLLLLAGSAFAAVHWLRQPGVDDPRAYAVSETDVSLTEALGRAGIRVPPCLDPVLRYALVGDGLGYHYRIYLAATVPVTCADAFLADNSQTTAAQQGAIGDASKDAPLAYRSLWMNEPVIQKMGWEIGPEQHFQEYAAALPTLNYAITTLVQHVPGSDDVHIYVYAFHGG